MTRLTFLLCWLILSLGIALEGRDACAVDMSRLKQSIGELRISNTNDERVHLSKPDDDRLLKEMLPLRRHKYLRLESDLEWLADQGVSQPGRNES